MATPTWPTWNDSGNAPTGHAACRNARTPQQLRRNSIESRQLGELWLAGNPSLFAPQRLIAGKPPWDIRPDSWPPLAAAVPPKSPEARPCPCSSSISTAWHPAVPKMAASATARSLLACGPYIAFSPYLGATDKHCLYNYGLMQHLTRRLHRRWPGSLG